jgi:hypothetical protein
MVGIILAPELGIAIAMHQNLQARKGLKLLRMDKPRETGPQDFESKNDKSKKIGSTDVESTNDQVKVLGVGRDELTKAHAFFANMGRIHCQNLCSIAVPTKHYFIGRAS